MFNGKLNLLSTMRKIPNQSSRVLAKYSVYDFDLQLPEDFAETCGENAVNYGIGC